MVMMDNTLARRQELAEKLRLAECAVNTSGPDWHTAGDLTPLEKTNAEHSAKFEKLRNPGPVLHMSWYGTSGWGWGGYGAESVLRIQGDVTMTMDNIKDTVIFTGVHLDGAEFVGNFDNFKIDPGETVTRGMMLNFRGLHPESDKPLTVQLAFQDLKGTRYPTRPVTLRAFPTHPENPFAPKETTKIDARPVKRSEVYEIAFRYLPGSPLSNGWKVAYQDEGAKPSFTSPDVPGVGGLSMDVTGKYAIKYDLPSKAQVADELELAIRYGEGAMFHVTVNVASRDGSQIDYGQIMIMIGDAPPQQHKEYPKEYLVWVTPEPSRNGWVKIQLRLPELVAAAMGKAGWVYDHVGAVQLRGCISVSPIKLFSTVARDAQQAR